MENWSERICIKYETVVIDSSQESVFVNFHFNIAFCPTETFCSETYYYQDVKPEHFRQRVTEVVSGDTSAVLLSLKKLVKS